MREQRMVFGVSELQSGHKLKTDADEVAMAVPMTAPA